jgi:hypothetical protein
MSHPDTYEDAMLRSQLGPRRAGSRTETVAEKCARERRRLAGLTDDERAAEDAQAAEYERERKAESDRQATMYG